MFYDEPFYEFNRVFNDPRGLAFNNRYHPSEQSDTKSQGQRSPDDNGGQVRELKPRMDLHEDSENNVVTATFELPGVKKQDAQIDLHHGRLIVTGENKSPQYDESGYAARERIFGKFSRTLQLPRGVSEDDIYASMENGILTVTFPKSKSVQEPTSSKKVPIGN